MHAEQRRRGGVGGCPRAGQRRTAALRRRWPHLVLLRPLEDGAVLGRRSTEVEWLFCCCQIVLPPPPPPTLAHSPSRERL
jgi:hypothetical protein